MTHSAVTIVAEIDPQHAQAVATRLATRGGQSSALLQLPQPLHDAKRIHFLSFFVFGEAPGPSFVVLEVNGDGSARSIRALLVERACDLLAEIFEGCKDAPKPGDRKSWSRFLSKRDLGAGAFYVANPGRSVQQIEKECALRKLVATKLDGEPRAVDAKSLWKDLQECMKSEAERAGSPELLPFLVRWSLHPKGARQRLRAVGRWLRRLGLGLLGLTALGFAVCALRDLQGRLPWLLALSVPAVSAFALLPIWLAERPVRARGRARLAVWRSFFAAWVKSILILTALLGLIPLASRAYTALPALAAYLPMLWAGLFASLGVITIVLAGAFAFVVAGRAFAVALALTSLAAWTYAVSSLWDRPLLLGLIWLAATVVAALLGALYVAVFLAMIRACERSDTETKVEFDLQHLQRTTDREDHRLQNHLATVTELRPGKLRLYALRVVLRAISLLATVYFNQGDLDRITSIHFARFVIHSHQGVHRLLFMGNYDGGFNAYLGAFSSVNGTTAVWSCTQMFPVRAV